MHGFVRAFHLLSTYAHQCAGVSVGVCSQHNSHQMNHICIRKQHTVDLQSIRHRGATLKVGWEGGGVTSDSK